MIGVLSIHDLFDVESNTSRQSSLKDGMSFDVDVETLRKA